MFDRSRPAGSSDDSELLEERLRQANEDLGKYSLQLEAQNAEIKQQKFWCRTPSGTATRRHHMLQVYPLPISLIPFVTRLRST